MKLKADWVWLGLLCGSVACSAAEDLADAGGNNLNTSGAAGDLPGGGGTPGVLPGAGGYMPPGAGGYTNPGDPAAGGTGSGGMPMGGSGGDDAMGGMPPMGGMTGMGGDVQGAGGDVQGAGGMEQGAGGDVQGAGGMEQGDGTCCPDGNCLCHGPDPSGLTSRDGPFGTATFNMGTIAQVYYPTDADPPFAGIAIVGGLTNTGPEMRPWGAFYASHGIVTAVTNTGGLDIPAIRATKLLAAVTGLKAENTRAGSPINGMMSDRYGTSGYSMGGGGTTIASGQDATLKTSVGLAAWGPDANGVQVPTLLLCGASDGIAPCAMSQGAYTQIPASTPKMMVTIAGTSHLAWFGPTNAGGGVSGETALAFQKVYLEGDTRWMPFLKQSEGTVQTNIQ